MSIMSLKKRITCSRCKRESFTYRNIPEGEKFICNRDDCFKFAEEKRKEYMKLLEKKK